MSPRRNTSTKCRALHSSLPVAAEVTRLTLPFSAFRVPRCAFGWSLLTSAATPSRFSVPQSRCSIPQARFSVSGPRLSKPGPRYSVPAARLPASPLRLPVTDSRFSPSATGYSEASRRFSSPVSRYSVTDYLDSAPENPLPTQKLSLFDHFRPLNPRKPQNE